MMPTDSWKTDILSTNSKRTKKTDMVSPLGSINVPESLSGLLVLPSARAARRGISQQYLRRYGLTLTAVGVAGAGLSYYTLTTTGDAGRGTGDLKVLN